MPKHASAPSELIEDVDVIHKVIGSRPFKWALGLLASAAVALIGLGFTAWLDGQVAKSPDVLSVKTQVDVLRVEYGKLKETADGHTVQLTQAAVDRAHADAVQGKIFDAIKQLSEDVHAVDLHVTKVDQKVDDLKDASRH